MATGSIYIDDAGNPGAVSGSDYLSSSRKSWTAVIVPSSVASDIAMAMEIFVTGVRSEFGASELHFTDIYSGRGIWKDVEINKRIEIFDIMKGIFESFSLPIVHQTTSEETLSDHENTLSQLVRTPGSWWDLKDVSHFGFLLLCFNVSRHVLELYQNGPEDFILPMPLIVDEGLAKAGTSIDLPNWGTVIDGPRAQFVSSKETAGIQMADFAAFSISRTQWTMAQQKLGVTVKRGDLELLKTTSGFNILNLPQVPFSIDNLSKEGYEFVLARDRRTKGLSNRPNALPRKQ